ncbi:flagellar filament capping protein FliD [Chitinilyticum piscinae]|uniref:Flagellar hook-associated protein 2 n=1 Tax=Chitinilyticum piscinae TaxID=2866724 RepID=A0A8J7FYS0_9NEIS|nr:flagellar filament capping protein FliD [Chitinilyticum piscinae]MBE9608825.1 flagellar filament capping protein FliD [Chitinilyticum piscinae]
MAGAISGSGGIDVNSLVSQLMNAERLPAQKMLVKETSLKAKLSAYGTIKGALGAFQTSLAKLNSQASYQGSTSATTSDDTAVKVAAGAAAQAGKYNIEVTQLATSQKLATSAVFSKLTDEVGTGTLTIDFGTHGTGGFALNPERTSLNITIDASNNSLAGVRDAINKAGAGVTASIVNDGTGYRLALSSTETGSKNAMRITVAETGSAPTNTDNSGLSVLAYDPSATTPAPVPGDPPVPAPVGSMTQNQAAKDAVFKVDGIAITKSSNVVSDAVDGLTLTLLKETTSAAKVEVNKSAASISAPLQAMVKAYNELVKTMRDLTKASTENQKPGQSNDAQVLNGESLPRLIEAELRAVMNQALPYTGGDVKALAQVGISFDRTGVMKLDESKLAAAMAADPDGVTSLFASNGRIDDKFVKIESLGKGLDAGNYELNVSQLATQGKFAAASGLAGSVVITGSNKSLSLSVDGTAIGIDLTEGTYTPAQLAAELQTRINSHSSLTAKSSKVEVSLDASNQLVISSQKYGDESKVNVASAHADLGLTGGTATDGVDAAGTLNGIALKGDGQKLYTDAGFKVTVSGGSTGSRGAVEVSQGFAYQLDQTIAKMVDGKGAIGVKLESLNKSIRSVQDQQQRFELRMGIIEKRYRAEFVALDGLLTSMQSQSNALSQQLAALPGLSSS